MQRRALSTAIERALRDQLALTDQPRVQIDALANEIFAALDGVASHNGARGAKAMDLVRREFGAAIARVRREYGSPVPVPLDRTEVAAASFGTVTPQH